MRIIFILGFLFFFRFESIAQNSTDLISVLGKSMLSEKARALVKNLHIVKIDEDNYSNHQGIQIFEVERLIAEITLYRESTDMGSYKGGLPHSLQFGMDYKEIVKKLGKPIFENPEGRNSWEFPTYMLTLYFLDGKLEDVNLISK